MAEIIGADLQDHALEGKCVIFDSTGMKAVVFVKCQSPTNEPAHVQASGRYSEVWLFMVNKQAEAPKKGIAYKRNISGHSVLTVCAVISNLTTNERAEIDDFLCEFDKIDVPAIWLLVRGSARFREIQTMLQRDSKMRVASHVVCY